MSKNNENILVPKLRFPEFANKSEWEKKALKSVSEVIMGSSPSSSSYNENKIGLPLLQGNADIKNRLSAPRIYTSEVTKECEIDDILLGVRAPVGTVAKSLHKACIGRGISVIRAINKNSQEYLYQWLFSYESGWQNISQGGTFEAVNSDDIRNHLLPIPLPQEQQKIASCLLSLDEIIKAESKKLGALKEHKKGLLQNLFPQNGETVPKLRFKEFEDSGEWEKNTMEEICKITSGGTPSRTVNDYWNGEIPWISTTLIDFNTINAANEYITEAGLQNSSAKIFPKNTILMAMYGQGKTRGKVAILGIEAATNQACAAILLKDGFNTNFVFQNLAGRYEEIRELSNQGGQENLSGGLIENIPITIPVNPNEQQKIASCLSSIDELINAQSQKAEALKLHKKGLLQGLFPDLNTVNE